MDNDEDCNQTKIILELEYHGYLSPNSRSNLREPSKLEEIPIATILVDYYNNYDRGMENVQRSENIIKFNETT